MSAPGELRSLPAARALMGCRAGVLAGLDHEAVARAIAGASAEDDAAQTELLAASQRIDDRWRRLLGREAETLRDAVGSVALQLAAQGVGRAARVTVAPPTRRTSARKRLYRRIR